MDARPPLSAAAAAPPRTLHDNEPVTPAAGGGGLVRLRLDLGYDGSAFAGWATQPGQRTVQATLEAALATALRLPDVRVTCAGRTDAGVHARGQVGHVDVPAASYDALGRRPRKPDEDLLRRLRGLLPADLRVQRVRAVPSTFDARFSALSRRYTYRVSDEPAGVDPLRRHEVLWIQQPLDVSAMNVSAAPLLGEHDFAAFCRRREGATTIRTLLECGWERDLSGTAVATVAADAFCHNMVRSLIGALLSVGTGQRPVEWPAGLLTAAERASDVRVLAPHGLTLEHVSYPPDDQLEQRSAQARRRRTLSA